MVARVHDRPRLALSAAHLPLVGEMHPLRREFEKWLTAGHLVTLFVATAVFATWYVWPRTVEELTIAEKTVVTLDHFPSPPPIPRGPVQTPVYAGGPVERDAVPEPVDHPVDPTATVPTRGELSSWDNPGLEPGAWPDSIVVPEPQAAPVEAYVWFDQLPELLRIDPPVYPVMVREAGIDGTVLVRVLIGVNGRVKEAVAVEGTPALHAAAVESARTAVFRPALQGTQPVEVWIAIPVVFQLQGR